MQKKIRILVGPFEIAGYYRNLCEGFKQLGISYDYITYEAHPFGYGGETAQPTLLRFSGLLQKKYAQPTQPYLLRVVSAFLAKILRITWVITAIFRYDVFIFGFGWSLIRNNLDLPILKILRKTVISNLAHGSEARPPYIDGAFQSKDGKFLSPSETLALTILNKARVQKHFKYSSMVIGSPFSTSQFATSSFINTFAIGIPFEEKQSFEYKSHLTLNNIGEKESHPIRILHSPSHPAAKGSDLIVSAVERLKQKGYDIELILVQGKPFSEVLKEIQCCDFVVDQLYSDTPMAGFATEAAWFGKPAVVGAYGFERFKDLMPEDMHPPSYVCHPAQMEVAIEELVVNRKARAKLGEDAQNFVRTKWNCIEVASRYVRLIEGDIPSDWWIDPEAIIYLEGVCQSIERSKISIQLMVEQFGVQSLHLAERPELERAFLKFADLETPD